MSWKKVVMESPCKVHLNHSIYQLKQGTFLRVRPGKLGSLIWKGLQKVGNGTTVSTSDCKYLECSRVVREKQT